MKVSCALDNIRGSRRDPCLSQRRVSLENLRVGEAVTSPSHWQSLRLQQVPECPIALASCLGGRSAGGERPPSSACLHHKPLRACVRTHTGALRASPLPPQWALRRCLRSSGEGVGTPPEPGAFGSIR